MALTFADTHNMIAYLIKSDASEGFDQIIDFLNASSIKYALTVNPNIYVSCIKQFWSSVLVKKVNDVTRLQVLVSKKKVIITEATIRDALHLHDAESIDCLPNEEIFTELSRMDDDIADESVANVSIDDVLAAADEPSIPSPPITTQPTTTITRFTFYLTNLLHTPLETCTTLKRRVKHLEQDKIAQSLEITKLKQRVKKLERRNKLKISKLRRLKRVETAQRVDTSDDTVMDDVTKIERITTSMDADEDGTLKDVADITKEVAVDAEIEESADDDELEPTELQKVVEVVTTAKLMTEVVIAASATITFVDTPITAIALTVTPSAARRRKGVRKEKEDNAIMRYQALKRKPEDLEVLWKLVKERFASSKPKNFSDDFLLTILTYMFEKPDVQAQAMTGRQLGALLQTHGGKGKLIQKLLLNQKCMGYLVRAYYSISSIRYYKDDSCWSADLKSKTTEDIIINRSFMEVLVRNHYVLVKKVLVLGIKPLNKTPYELLQGRRPALSFIRPFGCHVTILNTIDHLGKFDGKANEGFFVGYSTNSKAFRVFNSRTRIVEENLHVKFNKNTPNITGSGPYWLFDIDALNKSINYKPIVTGHQSNGSAGTKACDNDSPGAGYKPSGEEEKKDTEDPGNEESEVPSTEDPKVNQENDTNVNSTNNINAVSLIDNAVGIEDNAVDENIVYGCDDDPNMSELEDISIFEDSNEDVFGAEADLNNLESTFQVSHVATTRIHKDHPLQQVIEDLHSAPQIRRMSKNLEAHG
nr:retrovirus-related Pol polyprotein from transposon TNT 1-94 [Tanacetum cinerariifolium]